MRPGLSGPNSVIDLRVVAKTIGLLILALSATMLLPLGWSLATNDGDWPVFLASIGFLALPSVYLVRLKTQGTMRAREAVLTVAMGWVACAAASTLPFLLSGVMPTFVDAMFETVSGFTTTGATVLKNIDQQPAGIMYWRSLLHWLGGLGIIVIFMAVLPQAGLGMVHMFQAEVPGPQKQRLRPKLRETAKILLWIYVGLSVAQVMALMLAGMSFYDANIHMFGTMATGGFSTRAASVGAFNSPAIEIIIIVFMIAAGINFSLYYRAFFLGDHGSIGRDPEVRVYLAILAASTAIVAVAIAPRVGSLEAIRQAAFQVSSIMTTTGFVTADFDRWPEIARLVLLLLMFVGACAGSTGGAIKVTRLITMSKYMYRELIHVIHPHAVLPVTSGNEVVPERTLNRVMAFIGLYLISFVVATLYMVYLGLDLTSAASSVAATLGNVGPGLGLVGPTTDYSILSASGKAVLTFMMLLGRLEIFTVLAVITPAFWRR